MRLLLDTCAISEIRKGILSPQLKELLDSVSEEDVFLSVISFGELIKGISLLSDGKRKKELTAWLNTLEHIFSDRILDLDQEAARIWGEITANAQKSGKSISACDGLIAAIALRHGLHLLTRNSDDFTPTGVLVINPWK